MKWHPSIKRAIGWSIFLVGWSMLTLIGPAVDSSDGARVIATLMGLCPLPIALYLYIYDLVLPATNKSTKDDKKVHPVAFIFQYFNVIWGWTMFNMVIWLWMPEAYSHVDTITDPYHALTWIWSSSVYTSCGVAPYTAFPERAVSAVFNNFQFYLGWITLTIIVFYMLRTALKAISKGKQAPIENKIISASSSRATTGSLILPH